MGKEWTPASLFEVLESEVARKILALADDDPVSAETVAEETGASLPTVYRRLNALEEFGLLQSETQIDPDGNHYETYRTTVDRFTIEIGEDDLEVEVERPRDMVDRFEAFWTDLEGGATDERHGEEDP